jgi:hypothetical protein
MQSHKYYKNIILTARTLYKSEVILIFFEKIENTEVEMDSKFKSKIHL